ncbi:LysR family transcriptional regulator [Thalassococcus sp. S3]|uniref:LysR family transcriptional regulator n=1 Tax=Thalassococcus sp. S3 TaxID=2017482 RepID=UPI0010240C3C|nr:LysR family transcriptional regulator [Thalassococcus sp. S3]QBF31778.1 LysR family transcriptional regulator [Thalassococcus sp. S3]
MKNWDDLRILLAVKQTGSMAAAAKVLETNPATVSRRLARLGETLGFDPFVRTPDGWQPSDQIDTLLSDVEAFDNQIIGFLNTARGDTDKHINMTLGCPPALSYYVMSKGLARFRDAHPTVSLVLNDMIFQETLGKNDVIITSHRPNQGRLIVKYLTNMRFDIYGFENAPVHNGWVGLTSSYDEQPPMTAAQAFFQKPPAVRMDTLVGCYHAMRASEMPGVLPHVIAREHNDIFPLHGGRNETSVRMYLCYHETRRRDPIMMHVIEWISDLLTSHRDL